MRKPLLAEGGTLRKLLASHGDDAALVEELHLCVLARPPAERERRLGRRYLSEVGDRAEGAEDLMWALLTSQEFLLNH